MKSRLSWTVATVALVSAVSFSQAFAQSWPNRPVRVINPFPAGGGVDTFARPLAAKLTLALGQQFIVENQGGAGGTVGATNASRAPGDGYTVFAGAIHHAIAESVYTRLPYSIEREFLPVTVLAYVPNVVVMHPKHANTIRTLKDLIDYAKANPGRLNFGSAGSGTSHQLAGELFKTMTGTNLVHVPYKGAGPMMQDLIAGQVDMAFDGMGTSANQIKAGKLQPLAVTTAKRSALIPDIPTMQEAGLAGYEVTTWYALWAVRGTPPEVVNRLYQETVKVLQMPDVRAIWTSQGAEAGGQPPEQFAQFVRSEIVKWAKVAKDAGVKIDN